MQLMRNAVFFLPALLAVVLAGANAKLPKQEQRPVVAGPQQDYRNTYVLGEDDRITIRVLDVDEIGSAPITIDPGGDIRVPYIGRVHAADLTVEGLQAELTARLKTYIREPDVTVSVTEFRSQPVSVLGYVRTPGVHQLQGRKTLAEMLSLAGGLDPAAGPTVKITRSLEWGRIPLRTAWDDRTGQFSVAHVDVQSILKRGIPRRTS